MNVTFVNVERERERERERESNRERMRDRGWVELFYLVIVTGLLRVSDDGSVPRSAQNDADYRPLNVFTDSKGSNL